MVLGELGFPRGPGLWDRQQYNFGDAPAMSVAVSCSMALMLLFFSVEFGNTVYRFWKERNRKAQVGKASLILEEVFDRLDTITTSIPMLLLLFLISRLHGTVDLETTEPDQFTKQIFVLATSCLFLEGLFIIIPISLFKIADKCIPISLFKIADKCILICRIIARFFYHVAIVIVIVKFFEMVKE